MWPNDPSPIRVFLVFTSAEPSAEGIAAVFKEKLCLVGGKQ